MANGVAGTSSRILGIDPGLNITGYGVVESKNCQTSIVAAGVIRANGSLEKRLKTLHDGLHEILDLTSPKAMAIEELYSHYERPRTAILMGHARGVICLAAQQAELELHHYAATQVKKMTTGSGRASKAQVQLAIAREFGLNSPPEPPDVADALAIALCHHHQHRGNCNLERLL